MTDVRGLVAAAVGSAPGCDRRAGYAGTAPRGLALLPGSRSAVALGSAVARINLVHPRHRTFSTPVTTCGNGPLIVT